MSRFLRLGPVGDEVPALEDRGVVHDLRPVTHDIDGAFLADDGIMRSRAALRAGLPELVGARTLRVGAPIARPGAVVCVGQNYAAHAAESGSAPPESPVVFLKPPNTVVGAYDDVVRPRGTSTLDWEVELGVVIGRRASCLSGVQEALGHVAGYTVVHDVSERTWQRTHSGGQWSKGKSAPTFAPVGPWLVPADEVPEVQALRLWSAVNGEPRQDSSTADMLFSVAYIVWHLSQYLTLDPGDLVTTGTPQGVAMSGRFAYLAPGDTIELGVEGLGTQRQRIVDHP